MILTVLELYINHQLASDFEQYNPGPISLPPSNLSSSGTDGESTALEAPYPDTMMVDPQVLWLPPDRVGLAVDDPEQLFKVGLFLIFIGSLIYTFHRLL